MNGFLQRLAAAAMHPTRSIHPVVGSMFSPTDKPAGAGATLESSSTRLVSPAAAALPASAPAAGSPNVASPTPPRADVVVNAAPGPTEREPPAHAVQAAAELDAGESLQRPGEPRPTETPAVESPAAVSARQSPVLLHPLSTEAGDARARVPERRAVMAAAARPAARVAVRADTPREPDEIQIHIGRIEVTAVPPPAAPRTVKAPRRGLNLDEYLKRGGRGNR